MTGETAVADETVVTTVPDETAVTDETVLKVETIVTGEMAVTGETAVTVVTDETVVTGTRLGEPTFYQSGWYCFCCSKCAHTENHAPIKHVYKVKILVRPCPDLPGWLPQP